MPSQARRSFTTTAALIAAAAATAPSANADGVPVSGVDARPVSTPGAEGREYLTRRARPGTVLVEREAAGGRVLRRLRLPGNLSIPVVAYDRTSGGLSADGRTLVLIKSPRSFPQPETTLAVIDPGRMEGRGTIRLEGHFSFDALSPDGRTMYLIEYLSEHDVRRYAVRAYDLRARRLIPGPIVDPREPGERMNGLPMNRATGAGGRWEYTLYDAPEHPFIHALDTEGRKAFCIDLDALAGRRNGMWGVKLEFDGPGTLRVVDDGKRLAGVDTRTLRVTTPTPPAPTAAARPRRGGGDGPGWIWVAAPTALLVAGSTVVLARRRQRSAIRTAAP